MEKITHCPICNHEEFKPLVECKDHLISKDVFPIVECAQCGFRFTNPRPKAEDMGAYYESEDYISHSGSNQGLVDFLYQAVKKFSLSRKFLLISKYAKGKTILDIGCGTGEFLNMFKEKKWETLGIEPGNSPREFAQKTYGLTIKEEDAIKDIEDQSFDIITMWHVLEHVPNLDERAKALKRILKKDGTLIIAVPNSDCLDAKIYGEFWSGYDVPRHLYHFTSQHIKQLFTKHEMDVKRINPMVFDSFYASIMSERHKTGKSNLPTAFLNGLKSNISGIQKNQPNHSSLIYIIKNK